jgi:drug/metabolite transporter (DMT)-like permease
MNSAQVAFVLSIISAALFSLQFPIIKVALAYISSTQAAVLEATFTAFFCLGFAAVKRTSLAPLRHRAVFAAGLLNAVGLVLLFESIALLNPATVGFIGRLYFVYTSLIALVYFREYPTTLELIAIPGTILGLFLFSFHDFDTSEILGVGLAALYPFFFAVQNAVIKESLSEHNMNQIILYNKLWSLFFLAGYAFFKEGASVLTFSAKGVSLIFVSTFIATFLGLLFFLRALRETKFSIANIAKGSEIFFVLLFSYFVFPLHLTTVNVVGAALVFICIVLLAFQQSRAPSLVDLTQQIPNPDAA